MHAGFFSRAFLSNLGDQKTFGLIQTDAHIAFLIAGQSADVLAADADKRPVDLAAGLQLFHNRRDFVDRNREADALGRIPLQLHRRNADQLAVHIDQRAAAVAGIDGRVGLQHKHVPIVRSVFIHIH